MFLSSFLLSFSQLSSSCKYLPKVWLHHIYLHSVWGIESLTGHCSQLCNVRAVHCTVLHHRVLTPENLKMTLTERMKKETRKARTGTRRRRRRKTRRTLCSACGATRTAKLGDEAAPQLVVDGVCIRSHYRYNWQWDYVQSYVKAHQKNLLSVSVLLNCLLLHLPPAPNWFVPRASRGRCRSRRRGR